MKKSIFQFLFCLLISSYSIANAQWVQSSTGLSGSAMRTMNVKDNAIWACSLNGGLFVSTNNGLSWSDKGLKNEAIYAISFKDNQIFIGTSKGLFVTTNEGNTYSDISAGLPNKFVRALLYRGNQFFVASRAISGQP